jgi:hypothetical protein
MPAAERIIEAMTVEELMAALRDNGFPAEMAPGNVNQPVIRSSFGQWRFVLHPIGREPGGSSRYGGATLGCPFDVEAPLSFVNAWNRTSVFAKSAVYGRPGEGVTVLEMDIVLHGITAAYLQRCFLIWQGQIQLFVEDLIDAVSSDHPARVEV